MENGIINSNNKPVEKHIHNGTDNLQVNLSDLFGAIETVTVIPTGEPTDFYGQFKIYIDDLASPTTKRLYMYSDKAQIWNHINLT